MVGWRPSSAERSRALALRATQLGLNAPWSSAFFAKKNPRAALAIVAALVPTLAPTYALLGSWKVDGLAAAVLVPHLGRTVFASYLNAQVVKKTCFRL